MDSGLNVMGEGMVVVVFDIGINMDYFFFVVIGGDGYIYINLLGSGNYLGDCDGDFFSLCNDKLIGVYSYVFIIN